MSGDLFAVNPSHSQDPLNISVADLKSNGLNEDHLLIGLSQNIPSKMTNPLELNQTWYQKDLAHMTSSLMKAEINTTATALSTTLSPNMMSRKASLSLNDNVNGYYPDNWGNVDLGGLSNSNGWRDRPDVIRQETETAYVASKDIFHNVFGRDPSNKEKDGAASSVYLDSGFKKYNKLQKTLAYSKEGHDRIANIGIDVLGYVPSEELIKQEQARLAVYGRTQQDIRNDFAYSQGAHDQYANMSKNMLGYDANEATIHNMQDQAANGSKYNDIRNNFINSQPVTDAISKIGSDLLGRPVNSQSDHDWVEAQRQELFNNKSIDQIRYQEAHGPLGRQVAVNMLTNMGVTPSEADIAWTQDQLGNAQNAQTVLSAHAHGPLGRQVAVNMLTNMGVTPSEADIAWTQDQLGNAQTVLSAHAHGPLGRQVAVNMLTNMGVTPSEADIAWTQDQLGNAQNAQAVLSAHAHGPLGRQVAVNMLTNMGVTPSEADIAWTQDQLGNAQNAQAVLSAHAHGPLGRQVAVNMLTNMGVTPSEADIAWTQDQLGNAQNAQAVLSAHAHGPLGRQVAVNMLTNMGVTPSEADIAWTQDQLGNAQNAQAVLSAHAHGPLGRQVAVNMLTNMGVTPSEADIAWTQDQLGNAQNAQAVLSAHAHGPLGRQVAVNMLTNMGVTPSEADIAWTQDQLGNAQNAQAVLSAHAHGPLGRQVAVNMLTNMGVTPSEADIAWTQDQLGNGITYTQIRHQEAHGVLGTSMVQQMAQQKGMQLTQTVINEEEDLIEKQGFIKTQQQFNQTADMYSNVVESEKKANSDYADKIKINPDYFTKYQQMVINGKSNEDITKVMEFDIYQDTRGPVAKMEATEWGRNSLVYAEQMGVNKRALAGICEIESGCRNLTNKHGSISGPFQMTQTTYDGAIRKAVKENPGLNLTEDQIRNGHDIPEIQAIAAAQYLKDAGNAVMSESISNPTALDTRGYYQFGPKYGYDIAKAPSHVTMGSILTGTTDKTFKDNGITKQTTVGEWREMVRNQMDGLADESILNY